MVESASRQRRQRKSISQPHTTHTANAVLDGNRDLSLLPTAQRVDRASTPHTTPPRPARAPLRRITRGWRRAEDSAQHLKVCLVALLRPVARHVTRTAAVAKPAAVTAKLPRAFRRTRQALGIPCSDGLEEGLRGMPAVLVTQQAKRRGWRVVGIVWGHVDTATRQPQTAKMKNVGAVGVRAVESAPNGQPAEIAERWSGWWSGWWSD